MAVCVKKGWIKTQHRIVARKSSPFDHYKNFEFHCWSKPEPVPDVNRWWAAKKARTSGLFQKYLSVKVCQVVVAKPSFNFVWNLPVISGTFSSMLPEERSVLSCQISNNLLFSSTPPFRAHHENCAWVLQWKYLLSVRNHAVRDMVLPFRHTHTNGRCKKTKQCKPELSGEQKTLQGENLNLTDLDFCYHATEINVQTRRFYQSHLQCKKLSISIIGTFHTSSFAPRYCLVNIICARCTRNSDFSW